MLAIKGGKVVTVTNGIIENGTILIKDGKILEVGENLEIPADAEIIDAEGKWVTPGFIDAHTHISTFSEPRNMPGIVDGNETSNPNTAHVRALDALNPNDMGIEHTRKAGFTTCCTLPGSANVIGGTGISFKLKESETIFDIIIPGTEQMKMALGENPRRVYGYDGNRNDIKTRMGVAATLREALYKAKVYSDKLKAAEEDESKAPEKDFKLDALVPVVRGEMRCRIHCHRADDIVTAIRVAKEFNLDFIIDHCTEGYKVIDYLKANNVTSVIGPLTMGPSKMEIWGRKLETPGILEEAGLEFAIMEDANTDTKYLPTHIGLCIARGLSEEAAFESVTIKAARVLGLEKRLGSIEVGKDADIAIFDGFPFSNLTLCENTIIDGVVYNNLED